MADSLQSVTMAGAFYIFILSDSTDPEIHDAERLAFERLREHCPVRLYYRRRAENIERKPGNIAEWVRRFGGAYAYMIVLDADSLMSGRSEEHTSELQSLMRISYAVFCLKKKTKKHTKSK